MNITLPDSENVRITKVKLCCTCVRCGSTWGVYVDIGGKPPYVWNMCYRCHSSEVAEVRIEGKSKNG
jgi:hypothetical protein